MKEGVKGVRDVVHVNSITIISRRRFIKTAYFKSAEYNFRFLAL